MTRYGTWLWLAAVIGLCGTGTWAAAAAAPPEAAPAAPAADDDAPLKEQTIYIPYEKLREVFEAQGRGVFLPYERFQELWKAAREARTRPPEAAPPIETLIAEAAYVATVAKDVVTVDGTLRIEVLKEGWNEIPLGLPHAAITRAALGDEPARIVSRGEAGYALLVENAADAPQVLELALTFAKAYTKAPGQNSVTFQAPRSPVSRWDVRIPESGVKVNIQPLLAATEVPDEAGADQTRVLAFVGAAPQVRIDWTPKAEGAKGLEALATVQCRQQVTIDEGVTRTRAELAYEISRAELPRLVVDVPLDQKVVNVFDPNVREWSVEQVAADEVRRIEVQLFEPAKGSQDLVVELEKFASDTLVAVPVVRARNVGRQQGWVVVGVADGLRAEAVRREGLLQVDATELPAPLRGKRWDFSYRYATVPFDLELRVETIQPRLLAETLVEAHLAPEDLTLDVLVVYDVQRAGVFNLAVRIPEGFEVRSVAGVQAGGAQPVVVDAHHVEAQPERRLVVNLGRKALGQVALAVQLHRPLREPDLLAPTGKAATVPVPVPRVDPETVERESGRLVVYAPESLRVNPETADGLRAVSHGEAVQGMRSTRRGGERPALAYAYSRDAVALALAAERRKPQVTVGQLLTARIESGVVQFEARLFYDILYSGVKSVRLDIPAEVAPELRVTSGDIRHTVDDDAADLADGMVAWRLTGETELMGRREIRLKWERTIEKLDLGNPTEIAIPRLVPREVDRAWGQIVLAKAETIDVMPAEMEESLRPIDPQHDLMHGVRIPDAALAFEFHDAWHMTVQATRYEPKDIKATAVEAAVVRFVVTRGDVTSVQALYRMRSFRQRLVIRLPGEVDFDIQPVRLNGRPVSLEQGEGGDYFVPLVGQEQNTPFLLELRYTVRGGGLTLSGPEFPEEPAIQKVYAAVYIPTEWVYLGKRGQWTPELVWRLRGFGAAPVGMYDSGWLLPWVTRGVDVDQAVLQDFATDGRRLLFSTLRPEPGQAGALRVVAVDGTLYKGVAIVVLLALGLLLAPMRFGRKVLAVGLLLAAVVLGGVFLPSAARATVSTATVAACCVVLIIWTLWYLLITRPRDPRRRERREARLAAREQAAQGRAGSAVEPVEQPPKGEPEAVVEAEPDAADPKADADPEAAPPDEAGGQADEDDTQREEGGHA